MDRYEEIRKSIISFRDERDWKQFHNPKDIAISLNIEAGELLECFQWKSNHDIEEILKSSKRKSIEDEIADVANYLILLCNELDVDLFDAMERKIEKNKVKYPVDKFKGSSKKYNE